MKLTRIIVSAAALSALASFSALNAQEEKAPTAETHKAPKKGHSPQETVDQIDQDVGGLTADQKTKILDVVTKTSEQVKALPKEDREKRRDLMKAQDAQITALLTPEQQAKYKEATAKHKPAKK